MVLALTAINLSPLMTSHGDKYNSPKWLRYWLDVWRYQNQCGIMIIGNHPRGILQKKHKLCWINTSANELKWNDETFL